MRRFFSFLLCAILFLSVSSAVAEASAAPVALNTGRGSALLVDSDGKELIPPGKYETIFCINSDPSDETLFFAVGRSVNDQFLYALADDTGRILTDEAYEILMRTNGMILFSLNGLYGVMDDTGNVKIPANYTALVPNGEGGLLALKTDCWDDEPDGLYYIDASGRETATGVKTLALFDYFSQGRVALLSAENNRYGFVDTMGRWVVRPQFAYAMEYEGDYAIASISSGYGLIDKSGNWVITPRNDYIWQVDDSLLLVIQDTSLCIALDSRTLEEKYRITGEGLFAAPGINGYVTIGDNTSLRLMDRDGKTLYTAPVSASLSLTEIGLILVCDGPWGSLNTTMYRADGTQVGKNYQGIYEVCTIDEKEYFAYLEMDGEPDSADADSYWTYDTSSIRYGLLDSDGVEVTSAKFTELYCLDNEHIYAATADEFGLLDVSGEWIAKWPIE